MLTLLATVSVTNEVMNHAARHKLRNTTVQPLSKAGKPGLFSDGDGLYFLSSLPARGVGFSSGDDTARDAKSGSALKHVDVVRCNHGHLDGAVATDCALSQFDRLTLEVHTLQIVSTCITATGR